jgi:hypothetical protein
VRTGRSARSLAPPDRSSRLPAPTALALAATASVAHAPLAAQEPHLAILAEKFQKEIEGIAHRFDGVAGIHVVDLAGGVVQILTDGGSALSLEDHAIYMIVYMANYGGDGDAVVEAVSAAAFRHFSKLEGATPYGTRVPVAVKRRVAGGRGGS